MAQTAGKEDAFNVLLRSEITLGTGKLCEIKLALNYHKALLESQVHIRCIDTLFVALLRAWTRNG